MSNAQGVFSVQSFPLKLFQQPSDPICCSSLARESRNPDHLAVAGPSTALSKESPEEDLQIIHETAAGFAACLAADHAAVLQPDVDTPFTDVADVVSRLLPYHVFQQPGEDLSSLLGPVRSKGKEKARHDEVRQEIEDTRFALNCHRRLRRLEDRLYRTKLRTGTRPSPDPQAYVLAQSILEVERSETATINSELRNARNELDAIQREKRAASNPSSAHPTVTTFRPTYYTQTSPTQYYRTYSYAYTHQYSTSPQGTSSFYSAPLAVAQPTPGTANYAPSTNPIPVQLPVTSLSALHALGIVPIPAASVPPPDQPQPAAVLKGSTSNGTMLSLEINVSLLQSAQMSGLAILLNSLMSRGAGTGQANATTAATVNSEAATVQSQNGISTGAVHNVPITTQKEKDGTG